MPAVEGLLVPIVRGRAMSTRILLPPQDLPLTISRPCGASLSVLNLLKPKPLYLPKDRSVGIKVSITTPALQNIAYSSVLEISGGRLETKREKTVDGCLLLQAGSRVCPRKRSIFVLLQESSHFYSQCTANP